MSVVTRLYEDYATAKRAASQVDGLSMPGVETSILGGETLHSEYSTGPYYDSSRAVDPDHPRAVYVDETASGAATGAGLGAAVGGGAGLLAGLGMLAIPGIGPLVAAGWLAVTAVGALGGAAAGGAVGALVDLGINEEEAPVYSEAFRRGKVALSVRFPEDARMAVESALSRVPDTNLPTLRKSYENDGWRQDETDAEREARLRMSTKVPPML